MYSCTYCGERITTEATYRDYSDLAPYIKPHESFCDSECAGIEYATRKANAE